MSEHEHGWSALKAGVVDFDTDVFWCRQCGAVCCGWDGQVVTPAAEQTLSTMRAVLLQLEWMNKTATQDLCPWCDEAKTDGHDPDCIIAAALSTQQAGGVGE